MVAQTVSTPIALSNARRKSWPSGFSALSLMASCRSSEAGGTQSLVGSRAPTTVTRIAVAKTTILTPHLPMNATLLTALIAVVPASILLLSSVIMFAREKAMPSFLVLLGAACLMIVVVA